MVQRSKITSRSHHDIDPPQSSNQYTYQVTTSFTLYPFHTTGGIPCGRVPLVERLCPWITYEKMHYSCYLN